MSEHSLVARLRNPYWIYGPRPEDARIPHEEKLQRDRDEAADELERLRAALQKLADHMAGDTMDEDPHEVARRALEDK